MCGIVLSLTPKTKDNKSGKKLDMLKRRGPDYHSYVNISIGDYSLFLGHTHLCINGKLGSQPFHSENTIVAVNGEIYNHRELSQKFHLENTTGSDCEVILRLYEKGVNLKELFSILDGQFSIFIIDKTLRKIIVARDSVGITSLYQGYSEKDKSFYFSSEMKNIEEDSLTYIKQFKPGCYSEMGPNSIKSTKFSDDVKRNVEICDINKLRTMLEHSVEKRLGGLDDNFGFLLSGGLDSSIITSIASRKLGKVKTFSIGLKDSPDLKAAREVSEFLKTEHYEFVYTIEEGIEELDRVIYSIESYDITTVRASTPMYILAKRIKQKFPSIKVLFSGEGADELFGGYLYFKNAPDSKSFGDECINRFQGLHLSDCLRAHKSLISNGIECRVPFLDKEFVKYILEMNPIHKMSKLRIEKKILRDAFKDYIPETIYNRQKDQMSDAVGYEWIKGLKSYAESYTEIYTESSIEDKERFLYIRKFQNIFRNRLTDSSVQVWVPKWSESLDPSGLFQKSHVSNNF